MAHERRLRSLCAALIFILVSGQTLGVFGVLIVEGRGYLTLDPLALRLLMRLC